MVEPVLNSYEKLFSDTYGEGYFDDIKQFILQNDLMDFYQKAREDPDLLLHFGFHYGILAIVAFCYCKLQVKTDINNVIGGYFKTINSTTPETIIVEDGTQKPVSGVGVPIIYSDSAKDGITFATIDKYTEARVKCMNYLLRMKKFSKYEIERVQYGKPRYMYQIVDKYVEHYQLLTSY